MRATLVLGAAILVTSGMARAQVAEGEAGSFGLGQIIVTAPAGPDRLLGTETLGQQAMVRFNRVQLDDAINLLPGVSAGNSGGSRNERLVFVRGFDRFQVPLSIDGIRVYLPADNRLDFGRFLTPDVAEVQVAKAYASVLDGPGAMGGAINLVTRKPTKALEAEARATLNLDRDADYGGYSVFALLGTRQEHWYAQASYARNFTDHWTLAGSFRPVSANEDGGARDFSRTSDWRVNAKLGVTPNATDEYVLSYTRQEGSKNAPLHVSDTSNVSLRNWSWPYWTIDTLAFLSTTALSPQATLKTRAYYSRFDNLLRSWDNRSQTSQTLGRSFDSPYADTAYGGSAELGVDLLPVNRLTLAVHYRHDEHSESQTSRPGLPGSVAEPVQISAERNWSIAVENRFALLPTLTLTLGASYDWRDLDRAEDYGVPQGQTGANRLYSFPLRNVDALNAQGRLEWRGENGSAAHLSLSSRARFPTLFERFSSQFGTAEPNPGLNPERATTLEVGGARQLGPLHVSAALFHSWVSNALVSIRTPANLNRRENYGSARYYGAEVAVDVKLSDQIELGGNYSYIQRDFTVGTAPAGSLIRPFQLTDVPGHKGFAYLGWRPVPALRITPNLDFASRRTTVTPASANGLAPIYYKTGGYALAGLNIDYTLTPQATLSVGGRNLFDRDYVLTDGFPEPGRSLFLSLSARY
ncbi:MULTISPECIES: TonB-dependent receptor plug domain-containing protein [unclassified Sphingobium]|uniref:TonB-dependent receptor plug domain-containing protein n=1 Tax=unclassified Sphingobium TaxID=2611147 RepID=UPI002224E018|nr:MULTISPECIES: TonB-dependent receptor [unclassified Sphingobium]MCW2411343.1 iron complex outermembrane receptor protein [Sphingobium sp. B8D3D]MCW2416365.1 iron complex outermembrane receptor protein [Sphingobium sp. B8D3A]